MAFPEVTYTRDSDAGAALISNAAEAGLQLGNKLSAIGQLQSVVANLLVSDPSTLTVPAADVSSGTFGSGVPDTGTYRFPSLWGSVTALATPSALVATAFNEFASTVSGAAIMGFGTTNDVTLMNRAGTAVIGITANTTGVTMAGALGITGDTTGARFSSNVAADNVGYSASATSAGDRIFIIVRAAGSGTQVLSRNAADAADAPLLIGSTATTNRGSLTVDSGTGTANGALVIAGSAYGAGVASVRLNGLTSGAAAQVGTLTNAPSAGNPSFWIPVNIAGAVRYIPAWT